MDQIAPNLFENGIGSGIAVFRPTFKHEAKDRKYESQILTSCASELAH
jgi:hypothetical protein